MSKYAVFFAGSDQDVHSPKHVYTDWAKELRQSGYRSIMKSGVGKHSPGTSGLTGSGWATIIESAMQEITDAPAQIIVVGMSRGGVQAIIFAQCVQTQYPKADLFVFAVDPVQGAHVGMNDGSFDMRSSRWGMKGTRDVLKQKYRLTDSAPSTVPRNVKFYLSVLAQFRGKDRGKFNWGFTPQAPDLQNLNCQAEDHKTYELPGDHGYGVYTGNEGGELQVSRFARGRVTREMFAHHLLNTGFGTIKFDCPIDTLDYYCLIANEDLAGRQTDKKNSGFSFLRASQRAATFGGFGGDASSRTYKGRGQLVKSTQAFVGHGYYVNERHLELHRQLSALLDSNWQNPRWFDRYPNIAPWMRHNAEYLARGRQDREDLRQFIEFLENF
jgi:hypothetical protein